MSARDLSLYPPGWNLWSSLMKDGGNGNEYAKIASFDADQGRLYVMLNGNSLQSSNMSMDTNNFPSPLHVACASGSMPDVEKWSQQRWLGEVRIDDQFNSKDGGTPIMYACYNGYAEVVRYMLYTRRANPNLSNDKGETALYISVRHGHLFSVQMLLNAGCNVNAATNEGDTPLIVACEKGRLEIVKLLLDHPINVSAQNKKGCSALYMACKNNHHLIVKLLLNASAEIDMATEKGATPLMAACLGGHEKIVEILIRKGANATLCTKQGTPALAFAIQNKHQNIVDFLLKDAHAPADYEGCDSLLVLAILHKQESIVKSLLDAKVDVNKRSNEGTTALLCATDLPMIKMLVKAGADIYAKDAHGCNPLHIAAARKDTDADISNIIIYLNEVGVDAGEENDEGETPFEVAQALGHDNSALVLECMLPPDYYTKKEERKNMKKREVKAAGTHEKAEVQSDKDNNAGAPVKSEKVSDEEKEDIHIEEKEGDLSASMGTKLPEEFPCAQCGTLTKKKCARCKTDYFCGFECQKAAYAGHKARCLELHEERLRAKEERAARKSKKNAST